MKKQIKESPVHWIPIWIALGAGIGVPFNNIAIGVGLGTGIGFFFFLVNDIKNKKKTC